MCGVAPIVGPRYKCTVRKNYDVCEACEAKGGHPHPFLKIPTPDQVPRAMFTIIDENSPGEADIDIDLNNIGQAFQQFGQHFGRGFGRGGNHHGWGRHGPHRRWNRHGNNEEGQQPQGPGNFGGCHMNKHMKNKIGYFMRQMFGDQAMHNAEETQQPEHPKDFVTRRNPKRAIPLNWPTKVHVGCPGDLITVEVTFRNGGCKPYHQNFHLEASFDEEKKCLFAPIKVQLPETESMGTFTVKVPIQILESPDVFLDQAKVMQEHTFFVGVTNHKGEEVGYAVPLKVKIIEKMDESALYDKAVQVLAQTGMTFDEEGNFEKAIMALKEAEYHVDKACAMLVNDAVPKDKAD